MEEAPPLRILVTDGMSEQLEVITRTVVGLGHEVIARESSLPEVARLTATERPDVALVIVSQSSIHALEMIDQIVHEAACPVIALLHVQDRSFIMEAAKRGIFAYVIDGGDPEELQSSIDVVLRRFAEYHSLEGAFGRRAVTERAKGILMERHGVDEEAAFNLLRDHTRGASSRSWWRSQRPWLPGIRSCRPSGTLLSERERLPVLRKTGHGRALSLGGLS
jgi:AmiR/NasT family two-component response regulator